MDPRDLILSRTLACTPEAAFRCWTEPDLLRRFFAPRPGLTTQAEIDLHPGGRFYTVMQFEEWGEIATEGCVLLVEPGRRLVFTDALEAGFRPRAEAFFSADLRFEPAPGGCAYRVTARHADAETAQKHADMGFESGWGQVAAQLEEVAQTLG